MKPAFLFFICLFITPLASWAHTYLQVIGEPGAEIYLNDKLQGTTNLNDGGFHLKISPGRYAVKAIKPGYLPQQTKITLKKGDVKVWNLNAFVPQKGQAARALAKASATNAGHGSLTIYSNPNECEIVLVSSSNSRASWQKKQARWQAQKIPAGQYTVKAKARGKTLSYDLKIRPNGGAVLYFDFKVGAASLRSEF
jgi:hypothetical protein